MSNLPRQPTFYRTNLFLPLLWMCQRVCQTKCQISRQHSNKYVLYIWPINTSLRNETCDDRVKWSLRFDTNSPLLLSSLNSQISHKRLPTVIVTFVCEKKIFSGKWDSKYGKLSHQYNDNYMLCNHIYYTYLCTSV